MSEYELIEKWISVFGKGVAPNLIDAYITPPHGTLWHLFTHTNIPHASGDDARKAFDDLQYAEAYMFFQGYCVTLPEAMSTGRTSADEVDGMREIEIYIVAADFSWTYVRTHEGDSFGPYFCKAAP